MFSTVRFFLFSLIYVCIIFVVCKKVKVEKRRIYSIVSMILCIVLFLVSHFILPFENYFVNFDSPDKILKYTHKGEVYDVMEGENSCMIRYIKGSKDYLYTFFGMSDGAYKILSDSQIKSTLKVDDNGMYRIYHIVNTNDYYVLFTTYTESTVSVYNDKGEEISDIEYFDYPKSFYFYANDLNSNYYLLINQEKVYLECDYD